jgi:hypothetical protein
VLLDVVPEGKCTEKCNMTMSDSSTFEETADWIQQSRKGTDIHRRQRAEWP